MANFFFDELSKLKKQKEYSYKIMGYPSNYEIYFFSPYKSLFEIALDCSSIPLKFWDCMLDALLKSITALGALIQSGYYLLTTQGSKSLEQLNCSRENTINAVYLFGSAVVDPLFALISVVTRSLALLNNFNVINKPSENKISCN